MAETASSASAEVEGALRFAFIDINALTTHVDRVLDDPLYWFPVRHHSPAIARAVAESIERRQPKIVFIEGPSEAAAMIEFLVDAKTRPPVAIYSSFKAAQPDPAGQPVRYAAWYPIVAYSPEYVAMSAARKIGAHVVFIDLPHYAIVAPGAAPQTPSLLNRRDLEEIAPQSNFYRTLARAAGHRTFDETWDRLFETPREGDDDSVEPLRREVALFCAAVRATTDPRTLEADGTLQRERFMWQTIRQTLASERVAPEEAMVVCGGFHVFLDRDDPQPPPPIPEGTPSVTVTPYSYYRLSQLSGYGAGNRAPRFYELCYDHHRAGAGQDRVVIDYVIDVLKEARRRGEPLSAADAIGATQHAFMLTRLRGRRQPVLDDILDALVTCCCKGDPRTDATHLMESIDEVNIGTQLGRACFAVPEVASVAPEQWDEVVQGLLALAEPVVQRDDLDPDLFAAHVGRAARVSTMPFLRGAFLGVLTEMRRMKPDALAAELTAYARGPVDQQVVAGDFLHGVLRVSRTALLLGAKSLVAAVDELLRAADHDTFLGMLPRIRAAFESLHDRQRDAVGSHVAELYGLKEAESVRALTTSVGAAHLMGELDGEVARIMEEWLG